jgi:hypothetical protein
MIIESLLDPAWVWLQRGSLDRRIARGADLTETPRLARRARQLVSRRCRKGLAEGLRNLLDAAGERTQAFTAAVPIQRQAILHEQDLILRVAADLDSDDPVAARGVALLERLLTDGDSPFYTPTPAGTLRDALIHAHAALHLA